MRILHVMRSFDPAAGGPIEGVRRLAAGYREAGHEAEVVTLDRPDAAYLNDAPLPVHALGPGMGKYGYSAKLLPWLRANLARFDGVVVNGLWQYHGLAAWRACKGRIPYAVFTHGMLDPWFKRTYPLKHVKKWPYWALVEYRLLRDARRVLFTSEAEQQLAEESFWLHKWKGEVVPYGTPGPQGDADKLKTAFYAACPALKGRRFLVFLGRIHPKKGCDLLVEAFARIAGDVPELQLLVAGPDQTGWARDLRAKAAKLGVADRVHWPGMLTGDAKWGALYASEAFILPSHQENFGISVAEALACGRAVLISDKINIYAEIEMDGAALVEEDTLAGTERLLRRWIELSADERARMGAAARRCFEARYDSRRLAGAIAAVFAVSVKEEAGLQAIPSRMER
ncbi:MAG TPA: glycosyltransferase [Acidobacteriaceae bacterium]|nr:glycosyltransferase [Acidobacteriaceae bacterium]